MTTWTDRDLLRLDAEFAQTGVAMHARPMLAAMSILGSSFVIGVLGNTNVDRLLEDHRRLFPNSADACPGKGVRLPASVDTVHTVTASGEESCREEGSQDIEN